VLGVLLYTLRNVSVEDRAKAICAMRTYVRKQFADIRTNSKVTKVLWEFIESCASGSFNNHDSSMNGKKRKKRKSYDDESGDEFRPSPVRSFGRTPKTRSKQ
jgi:hypothetical protein